MGAERRAGGLGEIALVFLRLGATSFGGPAAHIAMMEEELVRRRRWLTREEFLDYLGATNLIPGPNSTELAIHIGRARAGWQGLVVAGASFILPAAVIVLIAAWAYVAYGALPEAAALLYGVKPVVIAIVAHALWGLARTCLKSAWIVVVAGLSVVLVAAGVHELVVLLAAGLLVGGTRLARRAGSAAVLLTPWWLPAAAESASSAAAVTAASSPAPFGLMALFVVFARIGAVLFGSGYVLLAFVRAELVERLGWLTQQQLLDATAIGQVTPGPVFTTATFIGYVLGGTPGAIVATLGIFLPAFLFVAISAPLIPRLRRSPTASAVLDGVNAASLALMLVVSWQLGRAALVDVTTVAIAAVALLGLIRYRVNSAWLVLGGGAAGLIAGLAG